MLSLLGVGLNVTSTIAAKENTVEASVKPWPSSLTDVAQARLGLSEREQGNTSVDDLKWSHNTYLSLPSFRRGACHKKGMNEPVGPSPLGRFEVVQVETAMGTHGHRRWVRLGQNVGGFIISHVSNVATNSKTIKFRPKRPKSNSFPVLSEKIVIYTPYQVSFFVVSSIFFTGFLLGNTHLPSSVDIKKLATQHRKLFCDSARCAVSGGGKNRMEG